MDAIGLSEERLAKLERRASIYVDQPRERFECTDVVVRTDDFVALVAAARQARRLRAAVEPFAAVARILDALPEGSKPADHVPMRGVMPGGWPTVGECRRARAALEAAP